MRLTAKFIQTIDRPGRFYDDGAPGLFVLAQERDGKVRTSFVQRLTVHGKRVDIGLGSPKWGATTLTEARSKAIANYRIARNGGDPRAKAASIPTFEAAADAVITMHAAGWRDAGKSERQWRASLRDYAFPTLGRRPVSTITTADVLAALIPIWSTKRETARRVRQRIGAVMKWAIAEGYRTDNPAGDALGAALPKNGNHRAHHRALPYDRVEAALATVEASGAWWATKAAFAFMVLTAARSGEVRGARWDEIDGDVWTVPGERMKAGRDHRVPLSARAMATLETAREHADGSGYIFPSINGRALSDSTVSKLLKENDVGAVPHGFRSSFRQWAAERTNIPREVAEFALAHVVGDAAERAYQRSDLFDRRRALMDAWARYLDTSSADVVTLRSA